MSRERDHRQAKKREKVRKKRQAAQATRGSRKVLGMNSDKVEVAARWPVWECYASDNWHEQGAHVHACFTRRHDDGTIAAAFFELDLEQRGVLEVVARGQATPSEVNAGLARRSAEERAMVVVDSDLVVKLVETAAALGEANGHPQPDNLARASKLFGSVSSSRCKQEILTGPPGSQPPKSSATGGWFSGLKRSLGLGG